jgi:hypothetical protein
VRRIKLARAKAQIEMIENITDNIQVLRQGGEVDLAEVITLRMIEALEDAARDSKVQAIVPQQMLQTLTQIRRWIDEAPEERGDSGSR